MFVTDLGSVCAACQLLAQVLISEIVETCAVWPMPPRAIVRLVGDADTVKLGLGVG